MQFIPFALIIGISLICLALSWFGTGFLWPLVLTVPLVGLGIYDSLQKQHNLLRNYPVVGHLRWLFEAIRPQIHQYFIESDTDGMPFDRNERSIVYQRAKNAVDKHPFGTELDFYSDHYEWINHSITPQPKAEQGFRIDIGGEQCSQPYSASIFNISAMSFGALSDRALLALNKGAKMGSFAHDTGEGGISRYHLEHGGDLIWEIGSGYFGCRREDGSFKPELFSEQAQREQVKMVEIKLSQGAKPGHGGVLPGEKVTNEIAEARKVPEGQDCISPSSHSAFSNPIELMEFIARLRELSGGKPTGFKLCIGHPWEFMAICKAILKTGILPDFIVVDGAEGGTGAAPLEFSDSIGVPLRDGLLFAHNILRGVDLRDKIKIGASGKLINGYRLAASLALGADWCNSARGFMFALGCVQSQKCHTNRCPTGVATQDPKRTRAIVVADKAQRVMQFHHQTVDALAQVVAAAGLKHPSELRPYHIIRRVDGNEIRPYDRVYRFLEPGELLTAPEDTEYARHWQTASAERFAAVPVS